MPHRSLACLFVGLALLACQPELPELGVQDRAVIDGIETSDWPAVGGLVVDYSGQWGLYCTGTLIARQWVLTAAHCVDEDITGVPVEAVSFYIGPDATSPAGGATYEADALFMHSSWDPSTTGNDIGLVRLRDPVAGVAPFPYSTSGLTGYQGDPLTWVGYGTEWVNPSNPQDRRGAGVKRYGTGYLDSIQSTTLYYDASGGQLTCFGDSGGATLMTIGGQEVLVGVNSTVTDSYCSTGGFSTRVDAYSSWIANTIADNTTDCLITGGDCEGGQACHPTPEGGFDCFPTAGLLVGQSCDPEWTDTLRCADGLVCLDLARGGRCYAYCKVASDCGTQESCYHFQGLAFGYCACTDVDQDGACAYEDCDDNNPGIYPGATEICDDGIDNNCDGRTDEDCDECASAAECDDGNPCTAEACVSGACAYSDEPDGMACGENMMCQIGECFPGGGRDVIGGCATAGQGSSRGWFALWLLGLACLRRRRA